MNSRIEAVIILLLACLAPLRGQDPQPVWRELAIEGGDPLSYAVVLPPGYDAAATWPVLLALPPGPQNRAMVEAGLARYWGRQAAEKGWVVVSPVAPTGKSFHRGAEPELEALLLRMRLDFRAEGSRYHLAGASNGGRSAFRLATKRPFEFHSLTVLPGYPPSGADGERLHRLRHMSVRMYVGGEDESWVAKTRKTAARLKALSVDVETTVLAGEGHVPPSLDGGTIMESLEKLRSRHPWGSPEQDEVARALHDFHDAAAKGDAKRYFERFTKDGVFIGTDATERWTAKEFREWAGRYFDRPSAWIYMPLKQNIVVDDAGQLAWFDEELGNKSYGLCRGTGVFKRVGKVWKLAHYNLTVPVPNPLMRRVVDMIRALDQAGSDVDAAAVTTVVVVRHAEKVVKAGEKDPGLTVEGEDRARRLGHLLSAIGIDAAYSSEFRRTKDTVAPVAKQAGIKVVTHPARDSAGLARKIISEHRGRNVVVAGHSNTVPAILSALGVREKVSIEDADYDNLFVVRVGLGETRWLRLRF